MKITWFRFVERLGNFHPQQPVDTDAFRLGDDVACVCPCGQPFVVNSKRLWIGKTRSCGCVRRATAAASCASERTYADARAILAPKGLQLLDHPDGTELLSKTKVVGAHRFVCSCGNEFGEKTTLKGVLTGNTKSCGCAFKRAGAERSIRMKGQPLSPARLEAFRAKWSYTAKKMAASLAMVGSSLIGSPPSPMCGRTRVNCLCRCGRTFETSAEAVANRYTKFCGCSKSGPEVELYDFVLGLAPDAVHNTRRVIGPREIDVYVPSRRLGIEMNGLHWHGERHKKERAQNDCLNKLERMLAADVRPLILFEDEWIERRGACEGYIRSLLGLKWQVGARKCEVIEGGADFAEQHHIQGSCGRARRWLSLALGGVVVASAGFGPALPQAAPQGTWELTRYCVGPEISVAGGLGKLLAAFRRGEPRADVITYSDRRLSAGGIYQATGFRELETSRPRYWYHWSGKPHRHHRFGFRKEVLERKGWLLEGETEAACMRRLRWDRIWDAGVVKWVLPADASVLPV